MLKVSFYDEVPDDLLKFAVIISRSRSKWVFCKHRARSTYECPGGRREAGERILNTARRELYEETGALEYNMQEIGPYSVTGKTRVNETGGESFGMLYFAEIAAFAKELHSEIEEVVLLDGLPENWTYPDIQPTLLDRAIVAMQGHFENQQHNTERE